MRKILLLLLFFGTFSTVFAQTTVHVKVTVTNSADLQNPKVNEIVSKVNIQDLKTAMEDNYSLQNRESLTVHLAFYDKTYIGSLNLKNENPLAKDQYVASWKSNHPTGNHILFLFVKGKDNADFEFGTLDVSPEMEDNHLFTEVMNFIRANLNGSPTQRVEKGTKYLANAIRPVWDSREREPNKKKDQAVNLANQAKYKSNRINLFHGNWKSKFLDMEPITTIPANHAKVYLLRGNSNDTIKPNVPIYADTLIFVGTTSLIDTEHPVELFGRVFFSITINERILTLRINDSNSNHQNYIIPLINLIEQSGKYSSTLKVSQWDWAKSNGVLRLNSETGLRDRGQTDRFKVVIRDMELEFTEGDPIPVIHTWYPRTYCNVFASDMSRWYLFNGLFHTNNKASNREDYAPWGSHHWANVIHYRINNDNGDRFKKVSLNDKAWDFVDAGYVVYFTAFHPKMPETLVSMASEADLIKEIEKKKYGSGHIATGFIKDGNRVIHVGSAFYDNNPVGIWNGANTAHVYLGYILNVE